MPPNRLAIRLLTSEDDLVMLTDLLHRAYRELLEMGLRFTATGQPVETTQRRCAEGECYVAELDGRVVGTIVLVEPTTDPSDPSWYQRSGVWHFGQYGVDPEFRGLGVGRALLDHVEARAASQGAHWLALDTSDQALHLIALYQKFGYAIVDTHDWGKGSDWEGGVNYQSVIMAKEMRPNPVSS